MTESEMLDRWDRMGLLVETRPRGGAVFSACRRYRYYLWRFTATPAPIVTAVLMLNPSVAGARADDPTIRRLLGFAARQMWGKIVVVNLYPGVGTRFQDKAQMGGAERVLNNEAHDVARQADLCIAAFGATVGGMPYGPDMTSW